jgi:poly(hydroxyalkanoate) depolymerase family esterase
MELIDWRELYAANRAVIERSQGPGNRPAGSRAVPTQPGSTKPKLRKGTRHPRSGDSLPARPDASAGGSGTWERFTYAGASGSRPYFLYTPRGLGPRAGAPLLVMLHGCTQTPADLARGTRMNEAADRHGFAVAYPQQTDQHNRQGCWNWFLAHHQARGSGEPALLAGITEEATARLGARVDSGRVFVAGMSAGAAAAVVMGATYPNLFSAIGVHSGLHYRIATSQQAAFEAMKRGGNEPTRRGAEAFEAMGEHARVMPVIVVHGSADSVVRPVNGDQLVDQWLATNRLAAARSPAPDLNRPSAVVRGQVEEGHSYTRYRWSDSGGRLVQEYLKVEGLGHAWSGGAPTGSYTDARGPDASEAMCEFFAQAS